MRVPMTIILRTLSQLSRTPVGGVMLFNHLKYGMIPQVEIHVVTSPVEVFDVLLGTLAVSLGSQKNRELKLKYFGRRIENNNVTG